MRKIREVLRLKYESRLSHRSISASTGMSKGSVSDYLRRAGEADLTWEIASTSRWGFRTRFNRASPD